MIKKFGTTAAEKAAVSAQRCREIVSEILNFGISQAEILAVIRLLALELESRPAMTDILDVLKRYETRLVQLDDADETNTEEN